MLYELGEVKSFDFAGNPSRSGGGGRGAEGVAPSPLGVLLELVFASNVVAHPHPVCVCVCVYCVCVCVCMCVCVYCVCMCV